MTAVDYELVQGSNTKSEDFVYDDMSNRVTYRDNRASLTTAYASNVVNEYTDIGGIDEQHGDAGNLTRQVVDGSDNAYLYTYHYDSRLVAVDYDPAAGADTRVAAFAYDAMGRVISR